MGKFVTEKLNLIFHRAFFVALATMVGTTKPTYSQETTISSAWSISPVFFVPLENGVYAYQSSSTGQATVTSNTMNALNVNADADVNLAPSGDSLLAGFSASIGNAFVATGADFAFANADGIGFSIGAVISSDIPSTISALGYGSFAASANSTASLDAEAFTDVGSNLAISASSSLELSASAEVFTAIHSPISAKDFNTVYDEVSVGTDLIFNFDNSLEGTTYLPVVPRSGGISLAAQNSDMLQINTNLAGDHNSLFSDSAYTSAFSLTAASFEDSVVASTIFSGDNFIASTSEQNAPAFKAALYGEKGAISDLEISADAFNIHTSGLNSVAIFTSLSGNDHANNTIELAGANSAISTEGDGAFGILGHASGGIGGANQAIDINGNNTLINTSGNLSYGVHAVTNSLGKSKNIFTVSGNDSVVSTNGVESNSLSLWALSESKAANEILLSGENSRIETFGINSNAITSLAYGISESSNELVLEGRNTSISTNAKDSIGYLSLVSSQMQATSSTRLSGNGSIVGTKGDNSHGVVSMTAAKDASSTLSINGINAQIVTFGDNSVGASLIALGDNIGNTSLNLSGAYNKIETSGGYSTGAYLVSTGIAGAFNSVSMNGSGSEIITKGDYSSGITFAGQSAQLTLSGRNSGIFTSGISSHGTLFDTGASTIEIGETAVIEATGIGSDGLFLKIPHSYSTIENSGQIKGQRNGLSSYGSIFAINKGSILGTVGAGITFDDGHIFNTGDIIGQSAIIAQQLLGGSVVIDTPGKIIAIGGVLGTAIDLQGVGDDSLIISPFTTITGTIDMGAGQDTLSARMGSNADLTINGRFESIDTMHSLVTLLEDEKRVLIADPALHMSTTRLVSDHFSNLSNHRLPIFNDRWTNGESARCNPSASFEYSSARSSANSVGIESSLNGMMFNLASNKCNDLRLTSNIGYYTATAQSGSTQTKGMNVFGFGGAISIDLPENNLATIYANGGIVNGEIHRRILNNTLDTGFEHVSGVLNGWFVNAGSVVANRMEYSNFIVSPFVAGELGFVNTSRMKEADNIAGLDIYGHSSLNNRLATGVEISSNPLELNDTVFAQFTGSLSASYSDTIGENRVEAWLGNQQHTSTNLGVTSELNLNAGFKLSLWSKERNTKAEFGLLHQESNRNSSSNFFKGSITFYY